MNHPIAPAQALASVVQDFNSLSLSQNVWNSPGLPQIRELLVQILAGQQAIFQRLDRVDQRFDSLQVALHETRWHSESNDLRLEMMISMARHDATALGWNNSHAHQSDLLMPLALPLGPPPPIPPIDGPPPAAPLIQFPPAFPQSRMALEELPQAQLDALLVSYELQAVGTALDKRVTLLNHLMGRSVVEHFAA